MTIDKESQEIESMALEALVKLCQRIKDDLAPDPGRVVGLCFTDEAWAVWVAGDDVGRLAGVGVPIPAKFPQLRLLARDDLDHLATLGFTVQVVQVIGNDPQNG